MLEHTQDSQQHSQPGSHEDNEFYAEELDNQSNYDESMPVIAHKRQVVSYFTYILSKSILRDRKSDLYLTEPELQKAKMKSYDTLQNVSNMQK
jgi:hypothetical protein